MKALTICQPFAHLICLPDDDDRAKRVENRTWYTGYRGPLLIHAGKNRQWMDPADMIRWGLSELDMAFGAVVGIANLAACVDSKDRGSASYGNGMSRFPWLQYHEHAEPGMFWWVLTEVRAFGRMIPCRGAQGLFDVPADVAEAVRRLTQV